MKKTAQNPPPPPCHRPPAALMGQPPAWALALALALGLGGPLPAAAQGTWLQTQCLAGAGAQTGCKAPPAWGRTGTEYVQALATAAGPGNLGLVLVRPETLPAANAARAQLAAVMLGYLDSRRPQVAYRWYGPVAAAAVTARQPQERTLAALAAVAPAPPATSAPTASLRAGSPPAAAAPAIAAWHSGALGDEPQAISASWWLAPSFFGATPPAQIDSTFDRYRVIRFLAEHCPQLEGRVAPNAWTLCTR